MKAVKDKFEAQIQNGCFQLCPDNVYEIKNLDKGSFQLCLEKDAEVSYFLYFFVRDNAHFGVKQQQAFLSAVTEWLKSHRTVCRTMSESATETGMESPDAVILERAGVIRDAAKVLLAKDNGLRDDELFDEMVTCIKYAIDHPFFFYVLGVDVETWINDLVWKDMGKAKLHPYLERENTISGFTPRIMMFLLKNWYLPRYDLASARLVAKVLSESVAKVKQKSARFLWLRLFLLVAGLGLAFALAFGEDLDATPKFCQDFWALAREFIAGRLPLDDYVTIPAVSGAYLYVIVLATGSILSPLKVALYLPRLFGAILVGYLPILVASDIWRFAQNVPPPMAFTLFLACFIGSYYYLNYEVRKRLPGHPSARMRVLGVFERCTLYALVLGLILNDLLFCTFSNILGTTKSVAGSPGLLGIINLRVWLIFASLAMLIGIIVNSMWEDKPITEAL